MFQSAGLKLIQKIWQKHWGLVYKTTAHIFICAVVFTIPHYANALVVTEIMYDAPGTDTQMEWIEVYNDTSEDIDFTSYKLFEANSNHGITSVRGDGMLSAGEYVVLAVSGLTSIAPYPNYSGDVYDSSFSLSNSGETFSFKDASGAVVVEVSYTGGINAAGDGNTLHYIGGSWQSRSPNPGQSPDSSVQSTPTNNSNTTSSSGNSDTAGPRNESQSKVPVYTMSVEIEPALVMARTPLTLQPRVFVERDSKVSEYTIGTLRVVTGDGRSIIRQKVEPVTFQYDRAGTYRIVVEFRQGFSEDAPLVHAVRDITVVEPQVLIGKNGKYLTLSNESANELDISKFSVRAGSYNYFIADGTVLLPHSTITLPGASYLLTVPSQSIMLVSSDGITPVSERKNVITTTTGSSTASSRGKSGITAGSNKVVTTKYALPSKTTIKTSNSTLPTKSIASAYPASSYLEGARDRSLIINPSETSSIQIATDTSRVINDIPITDAPKELSSDRVQQKHSLGFLLWLTPLLLVIAMLALSYWYLSTHQELEKESISEPSESTSQSEFGNVDEYVIIDKSD